jgi:hypothetical protein
MPLVKKKNKKKKKKKKKKKREGGKHFVSDSANWRLYNLPSYFTFRGNVRASLKNSATIAMARHIIYLKAPNVYWQCRRKVGAVSTST